VAFEDQIREAFERALTGVRAHLETDLGTFAQDLARIFSEERTRAAMQASEAAAAEVRRQAEAQVEQIRDAVYRQQEELKRSAEAQVAEIRQALETQLEQQREAADAELAETRRAAQAEVEAAHALAREQIGDVQRVMSVRLEEAGRGFEARLAESRHDFERQLEEARRRARAELDEARREIEDARSSARVAAEDIVIGQLAAAHADRDRKVAEAIDRTRTDAQQADLAHAARVLDGIRTIDDARSLVEVLDALVECTGREVDRTAVLVVKGDRLRGFKLAGFGPEAGLARAIDVDLDSAGLPGAVVRTGVAVSRPTVAPGEPLDTRQPALPPFAQGAGTRHAMALPIVVGGQVVAVLYADAPRLDIPSSAARWPAMIEVLARHASRALEGMTVQQATGLSLPRPVARPSHGALPGPLEHGGSGEEDAARRYARLLVSEIRMYHEPLVDAGRKSRDLRSRLGGEIDRARRLYEARVPSAVREKSDYFEQELVRTLADGDRSLLG
jgi:hypothetical protein